MAAGSCSRKRAVSALHPASAWSDSGASPTDGSSPARAFTPDLQPSDVLDLYSGRQPGRNAGSCTASSTSAAITITSPICAPAASTPIPPPAGTTARSKGPQVLFFGASSQYFYFSALDPLGWAPYRAPVSNPAAAERLSQPTTTPRDTYAYLVSQDESRILRSSWENGIGWLELMELAYPEKPKKLSPQDMQSPDDVFTYIEGNASLSRVVFLTARTGRTESISASPDTPQAGSGKFIATLDSVLVHQAMDLSESASSPARVQYPHWHEERRVRPWTGWRSTSTPERCAPISRLHHERRQRHLADRRTSTGSSRSLTRTNPVPRSSRAQWNGREGADLHEAGRLPSMSRRTARHSGSSQRPAANEAYQLWVAVRGQGPARQLTRARWRQGGRCGGLRWCRRSNPPELGREFAADAGQRPWPGSAQRHHQRNDRNERRHHLRDDQPSRQLV